MSEPLTDVDLSALESGVARTPSVRRRAALEVRRLRSQVARLRKLLRPCQVAERLVFDGRGNSSVERCGSERPCQRHDEEGA